MSLIIKWLLISGWVIVGLSTVIALGLLTTSVPGFPILLEYLRDIVISPWWAILAAVFLLRGSLGTILIQLAKRVESSDLRMSLAGAVVEIAQGQ